MATLGDRIKRLRKERGWTQVEFASRVGVHNRHVSRWEKGQNRPAGRTLEKVAEVFGLSVEELLGQRSPEELLEDSPLLRRFKELQDLPDDEQAAIVMVIDAFLTKRRMEQVLRPLHGGMRVSA